MSESAADWQAYLAEFHRDSAGITERVLRASTDAHGQTPYGWLEERIPSAGLVVDLACGSSPLWAPSLAGRYLGVDVSAEELQLAAKRGASALVQGSATEIPLPDGQARAIVCSMALMILPSLPRVLEEIRRVLAPDGVLVAMVPTGPTSARDLPMVTGLVAALGRVPGYPNDRMLRDAAGVFARSGLQLEADERRRYTFALTSEDQADLFADSLYLPGAPEHSRRRARAYLRRGMRLHAVMPVPIRRLIARPDGTT